jgi:hypothetical protein
VLGGLVDIWIGGWQLHEESLFPNQALSSGADLVLGLNRPRFADNIMESNLDSRVSRDSRTGGSPGLQGKHRPRYPRRIKISVENRLFTSTQLVAHPRNRRTAESLKHKVCVLIATFR